MVKTKAEWISTFRKVGDSILAELSKTKNLKMIRQAKSISASKSIEKAKLPISILLLNMNLGITRLC